MASIAIKALGGLATLGALGGSVYGIYTYSNTADTIENYLSKRGFVLIKKNESDKWAKVFDTYQLEKNENLTINPESIEGIKTWCNLNLSKKIKSEKEADYQKASKLCINFENIKDKLGTRTLETKEATLNSKIGNFPSAIKQEIEEIQITQTDNKAGRQIKAWCEKNIKRRYLNATEDYFKSINNYCLTSAG